MGQAEPDADLARAGGTALQARSWLSPRPAPPSRRPPLGHPPARTREPASPVRRRPSRHGCPPAPPLPSCPERPLGDTPAALRPVSAGPAWGTGSRSGRALGMGSDALRPSRSDAAGRRDRALSPEPGASRCGMENSGRPHCSPSRPQRQGSLRMLAPDPGSRPASYSLSGELTLKELPSRSWGDHPLGAQPPSSCDL